MTEVLSWTRVSFSWLSEALEDCGDSQGNITSYGNDKLGEKPNIDLPLVW